MRLIGKYGMTWNMTEEHYKTLVQHQIVEEGSIDKFHNIRVPLVPDNNEVVTVHFKGHRKFKAVVLKVKDAGQRLLCVWPAEAKYPGKVYLQYIDRWEVE